jgi:hypothetical protein
MLLPLPLPLPLISVLCRDGWGVMTYADGRREEGEWKEGQYIGMYL